MYHPKGIEKELFIIGNKYVNLHTGIHTHMWKYIYSSIDDSEISSFVNESHILAYLQKPVTKFGKKLEIILLRYYLHGFYTIFNNCSLSKEDNLTKSEIIHIINSGCISIKAMCICLDKYYYSREKKLSIKDVLYILPQFRKNKCPDNKCNTLTDAIHNSHVDCITNIIINGEIMSDNVIEEVIKSNNVGLFNKCKYFGMSYPKDILSLIFHYKSINILNEFIKDNNIECIPQECLDELKYIFYKTNYDTVLYMLNYCICFCPKILIDSFDSIKETIKENWLYCSIQKYSNIFNFYIPEFKKIKDEFYVLESRMITNMKQYS